MPKKSKVEELLETLVARVDKLENTINKPITSQIEAILETKPAEEPVSPAAFPIPSEFRLEVDRVLNSNFGIELEKRLDAPLLNFAIIVPDKYSLMSPAQREINHRDIRLKVITVAGGVNEVRDWCQMVYKNLTPELQAMVVADRMKVAVAA